MRIKWKLREGVRDWARRRWICEVRRSEKRAIGGKPARQRKLTVAYLGTLRAPTGGVPARAEVARFLAGARLELEQLRLPVREQTRLWRAVRERVRSLSAPVRRRVRSATRVPPRR